MRRAAVVLACIYRQRLRGTLAAPRAGSGAAVARRLRITSRRFDFSAPRPRFRSAATSVRLWARITNPNPFGLTLGRLQGTLFLEDQRAADAAFPLGLPLAALAETDGADRPFRQLFGSPRLADTIRRAASRQPLAYRLDGTIGVDAGRFGQPVFGPLTLLRGNIR